jgi:hypothetical protein
LARGGCVAKAREGQEAFVVLEAAVPPPARQPVVDQAAEDFMSSGGAGRVAIGMDSHRATIAVMTADEIVAGGRRFGTDRGGYAAMLR